MKRQRTALHIETVCGSAARLPVRRSARPQYADTRPHPAPILSAERTAATQTLIDRHQHLTQALAHLDAATHGGHVGEATLTRLTLRVISAAREFATATQPLIDHVAAITAALRDAAAYRATTAAGAPIATERPQTRCAGPHQRPGHRRRLPGRPQRRFP